ncbi:hypothetical protein L211DRAFT_410190 [Terfezia boudieri ATCC MYA-4762]|uniref:Uncharacterized protein n=1 Tax=Terfezia boudieri ATCC MYA-4762 TaxID=1051890 RepID=A0A3N4LV66_9PEZI|nr:hypothetical protein L211DRAFT_410190 [Terfezia boudieri ATCC MYA-4762]
MLCCKPISVPHRAAASDSFCGTQRCYLSQTGLLSAASHIIRFNRYLFVRYQVMNPDLAFVSSWIFLFWISCFGCSMCGIIPNISNRVPHILMENSRGG